MCSVVSLVESDKKHHKPQQPYEGSNAMKNLIIAAAIIATIFCATRSYAYDSFDQENAYEYDSSYGRSYPSGGNGDFGGHRQHNDYAPAPQRNYSHGGEIYMQNGYSRSNGTYVEPHLKTRPDSYKGNNLGAWGK